MSEQDEPFRPQSRFKKRLNLFDRHISRLQATEPLTHVSLRHQSSEHDTQLTKHRNTDPAYREQFQHAKQSIVSCLQKLETANAIRTSALIAQLHIVVMSLNHCYLSSFSFFYRF